MISAKMVTLGLLKAKVFCAKSYDIIISVNDSPTKFYHVAQIILQKWTCDQSLVTLALL